MKAVGAAFPGVKRGKAIDRATLGRLVFADPAALRRLEKILHPLVSQAERKFLARSRRERQGLVVLDIPLLFETGGERRCDGVLVVSAPRAIQLARVMARPDMTKAQLKAWVADPGIDVVISTGLGKRHSLRALRQALTRFR